MAVITKGIQLWYKGNEVNMIPSFATGQTKDPNYGYFVPDLQEFGDMATADGAERDKIEVTTLADDKHMYVEGLMSESESDNIEFKLLYSEAAYVGFKSIIEMEGTDGTSEYFLTIPSANKKAAFGIKGRTKIKVDGAGVNSAVTMTLTIIPTEPISFQATQTVAE
jgi:hypothetical protein